ATALRRATHQLNPSNLLERRLQPFEELYPRRGPGSGYSGSAIPLIWGMDALLQGDLATARERVAEPDPSLVMTQLATATLELVSGRPEQALQLLISLQEQVRGLRALSRWRLGAMAGAQLALRSESECLETLNF